MTTLGKITFITAILFALFLFYMCGGLEAYEIDYDSLRRLTPRGECIGGEIEENRVSIFYCKPYWKDITINVWSGM